MLENFFKRDCIKINCEYKIWIISAWWVAEYACKLELYRLSCIDFVVSYNAESHIFFIQGV